MISYEFDVTHTNFNWNKRCVRERERVSCSSLSHPIKIRMFYLVCNNDVWKKLLCSHFECCSKKYSCKCTSIEGLSSRAYPP